MLLAALFCGAETSTAQQVFTGFNFSFTRPPNASPALSDQITDGVAFARGPSRGLINSAIDNAFVSSGPTGTRWATQLQNEDETISADNFAELDFTNWSAAFGGGGQLASNIVSFPAVVHLVEEDIYFDIRFTSWSRGGGGGFAYERSVVSLIADPIVGDFNGDRVVDAGDFAPFAQQFGGEGAGLSADGNLDDVVNAADFPVFRDSVAPGTLTAVAVPSPAALPLGLIAMVAGLFRRPSRR